MKFRAHDTFFIRKGWLSKGMKAVHSKPDVFVSKDENPMDVLGIGSNMVKSLRYWLVATNLTEEALQNKRRIQKFTEFGNQVFKNDRFMLLQMYSRTMLLKLKKLRLVTITL